jgi:hypothetical protein
VTKRESDFMAFSLEVGYVSTPILKEERRFCLSFLVAALPR